MMKGRVTQGGHLKNVSGQLQQLALQCGDMSALTSLIRQAAFFTDLKAKICLREYKNGTLFSLEIKSNIKNLTMHPAPQNVQ